MLGIDDRLVRPDDRVDVLEEDDPRCNLVRPVDTLRVVLVFAEGCPLCGRTSSERSARGVSRRRERAHRALRARPRRPRSTPRIESTSSSVTTPPSRAGQPCRRRRSRASCTCLQPGDDLFDVLVRREDRIEDLRDRARLDDQRDPFVESHSFHVERRQSQRRAEPQLGIAITGYGILFRWANSTWVGRAFCAERPCEERTQGSAELPAAWSRNAHDSGGAVRARPECRPSRAAIGRPGRPARGVDV